MWEAKKVRSHTPRRSLVRSPSVVRARPDRCGVGRLVPFLSWPLTSRRILALVRSLVYHPSVSSTVCSAAAPSGWARLGRLTDVRLLKETVCPRAFNSLSRGLSPISFLSLSICLCRSHLNGTSTSTCYLFPLATTGIGSPLRVILSHSLPPLSLDLVVSAASPPDSPRGNIQLAARPARLPPRESRAKHRHHREGNTIPWD
jgi:hypothetical protein